ncbi:hypothetical protein JOC78_000222 [Bacillus ectoiniformans]|uniref:hypothetical protein n=1 Tax=Bacillus ectoiniformans TaxID=1494429 RepID=UPI003084063D|nr:hypothetical protein [Bacillus ectoiniformans]
MSDYMVILIVAVTITFVFSLIYTMKVLKSQGAVKEMDQPIPETVQHHPYTKNPIFWAYVIGIGLALAFIIYAAVASGYL